MLAMVAEGTRSIAQIEQVVILVGSAPERVQDVRVQFDLE